MHESRHSGVNIPLSVVLGLSLGLSACSTPCYNEQFCQDMVGRSSQEALSILGAPSSIQQSEGGSLYSWKTEKEVRTRKYIPSAAPSWSEDSNHRLSAQNSAELVIYTQVKTAEISFMLRDGRIVSYFNHADEGMCNALLPSSTLKQYQKKTKP